LCDADVDATKGYPRRETDKATGKMKEWEAPFILMVDRGGCTFVKKVSTDIRLLCILLFVHSAIQVHTWSDTYSIGYL